VTVACGVVENGRVIVGGDSALSADTGDQTIGQPKVFAHAGMLFAGSGEMRTTQLLRYVFEVPACGVSQDPEEYIVRDLSRQFRTFLNSEAPDLIASIENDDEIWAMLIAVRGRLFRLCSHFTVREAQIAYDAIGSGTPFALGSFASTEGRPGRERVELALKAAERHVPSVRGPFNILEI
jgi:hypothetical protein